MPAQPAPPGTKFCQGCADKGRDPHRSLNEFADKGPGKKQARCRECHNEQVRDHYRTKTDYYKGKTQRRRQENSDWFKEFKGKLRCNRCPEDHPACLQFHHTDPSLKEIGLAVAVNRGWSIQRILEEASKCEVLCANCHAKEHYRLKYPRKESNLQS